MKRILVFTSCCFLLFGSIFVPVTKAKAQSTEAMLFLEKDVYTVYVNKLNIRSAPNTKSKVVGYYTKGQKFKVDQLIFEHKIPSDGYPRLWVSYIAPQTKLRRYVIARDFNDKLFAGGTILGGFTNPECTPKGFYIPACPSQR